MGVLCLSSDDTQTLQQCSWVRAPAVVWIILYFTVDSLYWQIDTVEINTAWKEKNAKKEVEKTLFGGKQWGGYSILHTF